MTRQFNWKKWDSAILVALLGILIAKPEYCIKISAYIINLVPESWNWLGDWTIIILFGLAGLAIGYFTDKS